MSITVIGLTGQTGAGKSAVSAFFRDQGIPVIDCDKVSRAVTQRGEPALLAIADAFSTDVITNTGELDRKALGKIVFSDKKALAVLNAAIFPFIIDRICLECEKLEANGEKLVILDAPTLFESGADKLCSYIVAVCADGDIRKQRIMARDSLTEEEALSRMNSQHTEEFFRANCHCVIENNFDTAHLFKKAKTCSEVLKRLAADKN